MTNHIDKLENRNHKFVRNTFLPFALPDLDGTELLEIKNALESGWVTTGPKVRQFEAEFARAVGAKHAIAVNSCTAAMHLALEAIGLKRGDEVITSPYTFAATAEVIRYFDAKPVFVDINPGTFNLNVGLIEGAISPRTRAIIPVHIGGLAADMDELFTIARKHHLAVIEDAAHAFPAACKGRSVGSLGSDATCFSFYATKTITTGEGGMICTDDELIADRCRVMALHGISKDAWKRYTAEGSWYYEIVAPGYKYNMTDVAAAMGLAQLRKANGMLERRIHIAATYNKAFADVTQLEMPALSEGHAWHLYMLRLKPDVLHIDRSQFMLALKERNIGASVHFIPLHIHPYYCETYGYKTGDFPVAYNQYLNEISLPIYSKMSDEDVNDVIRAVLEIVREHAH